MVLLWATEEGDNSERGGIVSAMRTWFLPSTSFQSKGCVFKDNSGLPDREFFFFFFFLSLGFRGHLGNTVWNFPAISVLNGRNICSQDCPCTSRQHRRRGGKGQGEAAGEP